MPNEVSNRRTPAARWRTRLREAATLEFSRQISFHERSGLTSEISGALPAYNKPRMNADEHGRISAAFLRMAGRARFSAAKAPTKPGRYTGSPAFRPCALHNAGAAT